MQNPQITGDIIANVHAHPNRALNELLRTTYKGKPGARARDAGVYARMLLSGDLSALEFEAIRKFSPYFHELIERSAYHLANGSEFPDIIAETDIKLDLLKKRISKRIRSSAERAQDAGACQTP